MQFNYRDRKNTLKGEFLKSLGKWLERMELSKMDKR